METTREVEQRVVKETKEFLKILNVYNPSYHCSIPFGSSKAELRIFFTNENINKKDAAEIENSLLYFFKFSNDVFSEISVNINDNHAFNITKDGVITEKKPEYKCEIREEKTSKVVQIAPSSEEGIFALNEKGEIFLLEHMYSEWEKLPDIPEDLESQNGGKNG